MAKEDDVKEKISKEVAMPIEDLPEVLIVDILSRLPVKSLISFRCVCKLWYALVTDPAFIKMHLARNSASNSNLSLIVFKRSYSRDSSLYSLDLYNHDRGARVKLRSPHYANRVVGSCNGLLCILSYDKHDTSRMRNRSTRIFIWNPCIRRHQMLPVTPIEHPGGFGYYYKIFYGFGHDPTIDDYKLVRIVQFDDDGWNSEVKFYSLSTNSWRWIGYVSSHLSNSYRFGVLANSAIHWVAKRKKASCPHRVRFIVSFDFRDEEYREMPLPDFIADNEFKLNVGVLAGQLCVLCFFSVGEKFRVGIWVMKDYGVSDSWVKQFSIGKPLVINRVNKVRPICYLKNGKVILENDSRTLISYNSRKDKVTYHWILGKGRPGARHFRMKTYVGSLVPLNAKDETQQWAEVESGSLAMN